MVNKGIYKLIWRLVAVICMLAWGIIFVFDINLCLNGYEMLKGEIFTPFMITLFCGITILVLSVLIIYPLEFRPYAILCCTWGLMNIIDGGSTTGLFMYGLGIVFALKARFFKTHEKIKIIIVVLFPVCALISQVRFGIQETILSIIDFLSVALMGGMVFLLFLPEIRKQRKQSVVNTTIVYIPAEQFTARDIRCLKRVQAGHKYESISKDENIGLSTLKNRMKLIYKSLDVYDKTSFMSAYSNHTILLRPSTTIAPKPPADPTEDDDNL